MIHPSAKKISKSDALHVLNHFGQGGMQPGGFTQTLLEAMGRADSHNFTNLALGFPGLVAAFRLASKSEDGIEVLQAIAGEKSASVATLHLVN